MFSAPTVFVCSATGSQGGSVARRLLSLNMIVRSTTRNIKSPAAVQLEAAGVHFTEGNWENVDALRAGISGCDKLYLCLLPNFADLGCELRQAKSILNIAKAAGVKQVVVSTSLGVTQLDAGVQFHPDSFMKMHLTNKKAIEQAALEASFEHCTIIRPGFFMANFLEPKINRYPEVRDNGTWTTCMTASSKLPLVDHEDIAKVAVESFQKPEEFDNREIGVASDLLTVQETLDLVAETVGKPGELKAVFMTDEEVENMGKKQLLMNGEKAMRTMADYIDMESLRKMVELTTFKEFLVREKEVLTETFR